MLQLTIEKWLKERRPAKASGGRLSPGTLVDDWRIEAFLGAGMSAEVYRVMNVRFGQEGALKLLVDGTKGLRARFLAEADAIRFLSLPALPRFLGAGVLGGEPYFVMDYLQPLPDPMPRAEVPRFMNKVAKAVQMLHDSGYIHRDIKPANILVRKNGDPALIDLGLIKKRGLGAGSPIIRCRDGISIIDGKPVGVGTLDYAAPEQLLKGEYSVQGDVFALGKLLVFFYGGRIPWNVRNIVRRATRESPGDRYRTADAFASALRHRNRLPAAVAFLAAMALALVVSFPVLRPVLRERLGPVLNPPKSVFTVTHHPNETDAAYFSRILPYAERGNVESQVVVAEAFFYGRGVPTNRVAAVRWYRLAAEKGDASAQASLGLCLFRGWGCEVDKVAAVEMYRMAAEQGHLGGISDFAYCLLHGIGTEQDVNSGFQWAMNAAVRGHAPAQTLVGECYLDGLGVEQDPVRAETWLYRAARQGNARAQMLLRTR